VANRKPPPTCPFIYTYNVKERKRPTPWLTLFSEGDHCADNLVTAEANHMVRRCGGIPLGPVLDSVKRFFAIFFQ
jgi:hypothetical protein